MDKHTRRARRLVATILQARAVEAEALAQMKKDMMMLTRGTKKSAAMTSYQRAEAQAKVWAELVRFLRTSLEAEDKP